MRTRLGLLVAAAAVLLTACPGDDDTGSRRPESPPPRAATTVPSSTTTTVSADDVVAREPLSWGWERRNFRSGDTVDGYGSPSKVLVGSGEFLAVGFSPSGCCWQDLMGWVSEDGRDWRAVDRFPETMRAQGFTDGPQDFAAWGDGFVAVGSVLEAFEASCPGDGCEPDRTPTAAVWRSHDGATWERVPLPPEVAQGAVMQDVVELDGRLMALGGTDPHGRRNRPVGWTSDDGVVWRRHPLEGSGSVVTGVGEGRGEGWFVVAARSPQRRSRAVLQVVTRDFGMRAVEEVGEVKPHELVVVDTPEGATVLDRRRDLAWSSADGVHWDGPSPVRGVPESFLNPVTLTPQGYLTAVPKPAEGPHAPLYRSQDLLRWAPVPDVEGSFGGGDPRLVLAVDDDVVVLGGLNTRQTTMKGEFYRPVAWVWTPPEF